MDWIKCLQTRNQLLTKYGQVHTHAFGSGLYLELSGRYRSIQHHSRVLCPDLDDMLSFTLLISSQSKSVSSSDYSHESVASCLPDVMYGHSDPILVSDRGICR